MLYCERKSLRFISKLPTKLNRFVYTALSFQFLLHIQQRVYFSVFVLFLRSRNRNSDRFRRRLDRQTQPVMGDLRQKSRLEAASRQQECCLSLASTFWCIVSAFPRSWCYGIGPACLGLVSSAACLDSRHRNLEVTLRDHLFYICVSDLQCFKTK